MDCGPTCLSMIAKFYGKTYPASYFRKLCGISREGVSLLGLSEAAESIGFQTLCAKITIEQLAKEIALPCILHWDSKHYVICYKVSGLRGKYKFHISDPAIGNVVYETKDLRRMWISDLFDDEPVGLAMQIEPGANFNTLTSPVENSKSWGLRYFLPYILPHKWQIFQLLLGTLAMMFLGYFSPLISQVVVDYGILGRNLQFIMHMMLMQIGIAVSTTALVFVQAWISLHMNTLININLISDYLKKLSHMPIAFFEQRTMGDVLQRIGDHSRIKNFLMNDSISVVLNIATFVVFTFILALYNPTILMIFAIGNIVYVSWVVLFLKYRREIDNKSFIESSKLQNKLVQFVRGMTEIKLNGLEQQKCWEWQNLQARLYKLSVKEMKIGQIQTVGNLLFSSITSVIISYIAANKVVSGEMTLGMMITLSFIIGQVAAPLSSFIGFVHNYQDAKISLERLSDLHLQEDEKQLDQNRHCKIDSVEDIQVENLFFSYTGKERKWTLNNISFVIPKNTVTAIVGSSGSGKTTLLKLLQGFYAPTKGHIKVGAHFLEEIQISNWRKQQAAVMQDGFIFSDTIANNITVYDQNLNEDKMKQAATMANILNFIEELPNGFNTKIGDEGVGLSQGQRQRILLARAIYRTPLYLFMDEATNAMDTMTESIITSNLFDFYSNRTVVIAAHRLNTIKEADNIIVMDAGTIVEQGKHDDLIKKEGAYYQLVKAQLNT